jgi:hypothetical protein
MYEPNQQPNQMVLACDKQMQEDEIEPHKATSQPTAPASLDLDALAAKPFKKAGPDTFM